MSKTRTGIVVALAAVLVVATLVAATWPRGTNPVSVPSPSGIHRDIGGGAPAATPKPRPSATPRPTAVPAAPKYVVLMVLDGARPDYFNVPGIPHIQALVRNGTQYSNAFAGLLESETPSGHASIDTGSQPRNDGILSFNWADGDNTTVNLFDPSKIRNGDMERILKAANAPTLAGLIHQKSSAIKVVALGGHKYYANDALGGPDANVIMYYTGTSDGKFAPTFVPGHPPPAGVLSTPGLAIPNKNIPLGGEDHLATKLAVTTFQHMHQQVTLMNMPEFDWPLGHINGGDRDPSGVRTLMRGLDQDLATLEDAYRKAGVLDQTMFVLTADHGMAPIYHTVPYTDIQQAVARAGTQILTDSYHTADYLWIKDSSKAAAVALNIAQLQNPYIQAVYFKSPLPGGGSEYIRATGSDLFRSAGTEAANQYLLQTFNGPNGPDIAVLLAEDSASLPGGEAPWKGDHGGTGWESQHIPLVFSGPGVRRGYVSSYPAELMNIAPTILQLMGASSRGMQGVPLADAMAAPPASLSSAQQGQAQQIAPVVSALQQESKLEVAAGR